MKKQIGVICMVLAGASMLFANGSKDTGSAAKGSSSKPVNLVFSTDQVGSSTYVKSAGLAQLWQKALPAGSAIDVQPTSPGGMAAPYLFSSGAADIAFANGAPAKWAYEKGNLGRPATKDFRALVGSLSAISAVNFMTTSFIKKYGTDEIEEVIARKLPIRIGCSPKGSMDYKCVELLLSYLKVTPEDIKSWGGDVVNGGGSDLGDMLKNGKLDMILDHTSAESSGMVQNAMTNDLHFTQWRDATLDYFVSEGFERVTLPGGSFKGQPNDVVDAGTPDCVFVKVDMADDVAYALTKAMCENREYLVKNYPSMEPFDPATCWQPGKVGGVPLHPGAERYFREVGYMK
ncbi:MAG: hypothetical protein K6E51_00245 [Treponema sp.]|nr:hypothetical protein [Treponema sp.]